MKMIDLMRRVLSISIIILSVQMTVDSQEFIVYDNWDFENADLGFYSDEDIRSDFDVVTNYHHNSGSIVIDTINNSTTKVLKVTHEANKVSVGFDLDARLSQDFEEVYLTYNMKFGEEFNSSAGGKLPGLGGFPVVVANNCPTDGRGFLCKSLFVRANALTTYHYDDSGYGCPWGTSDFKLKEMYFTNGSWYNITRRLVMNTFTDGIPNRDGIHEVWVDGIMIFQENNIIFMEEDNDTMKIDDLNIAHFYGGGISYAPLKECYGYMDNFTIWMPSNDSVIGHKLHDPYSVLPTPNVIIDRDLYYDELITTDGTITNYEYGQAYSPCIDEAYLIDAGQGNSVTLTLTGGTIGGGAYLFIYDGKRTDSEILYKIEGYENSLHNTYRSSGRYLFVRFSNSKGSIEGGFIGEITFNYGVVENNTPLIENQSFEIDEDNFTNNFVGKIVATEEDEGQSLTFSIEAGNTNNLFTIDEESGDLFVLGDTIFELTPDEYNLTVRVEDDGEESKSNEATIKIIVLKSGDIVVNNPPVIDDQQFTISENTFDANFIGKIIASDPDLGQTLSYSILSGNESGLFNLDSESGELSTTSNLIFDLAPDSYNLVIAVEDDATESKSSQADISIFLVKIGEETNNTPPVINDQQFVISENDFEGGYIGKVIATEEDPDQALTYSILSGNDSELFALDAQSGELITTQENLFELEPNSYDLIVQVTDDGEESKSDNAVISIVLDKISRIIYIDPENTNDEQEAGTLENPYDSWQDVEWIEGYSYLQKRGSVANEASKISIYANDVTIGAYGEGEKPIIRSTTNEYAFKAFEKRGVTIQNLHIIAEDAINAIYFLGDITNNIHIENNKIEGSIYGVRIVGGEELTIQYNTFRGNNEAVYSYAKQTNIFYNVFESNQNAIHIDGENSIAEVYNNVFYDNSASVSTDYAELTLHNNIFYLAKINDKAIEHNGTKLVSDYNLFYPNQDGLIRYNGENYTNLAEFQEIEGIDANSFTSDPKFVDIFSHDFSLKLESPAIDAGIYLGITADLMGEAVPYGDHPDLGVIEINEPANPTIVKVNENNILNVFPNPTDGIINIAVENPEEKNADLQIQDINGIVVLQNQFSSFEQNFIQQVDISELPAGIYILSLKIANSLYSKRITKSF
jgi:hypothetical protein